MWIRHLENLEKTNCVSTLQLTGWLTGNKKKWQVCQQTTHKFITYEVN